MQNPTETPTQPAPADTGASADFSPKLYKPGPQMCGANDRCPRHPQTIHASVIALHLRNRQQACVRLELDALSSVEINVDMSPANARALAAQLLESADVVYGYEADNAFDAEMARYNAGPFINRIELPGGVVAFEPVAAQGGA